MRTNKTLRIASILLIAVLMTSCIIGSTMAKYSTSVDTETSTAQVAVWNITSGTGEGKVSITGSNPTIPFDLFEGITTNSNVATAGDGEATIIAPGTSGKFALVINNESEVNATANVTFTVQSAGVPLQFQVVDGETTPSDNGWKTAADAQNGIQLNMGASKTITVHWRWDPTSEDTVDTPLGVAGTASPTVKATISVDQVVA